MLDHEQRIGATLRAVSDDVRTRPSLVADVRQGALRRRRRRRVAGGAAVAVGAAAVASAIAVGGLHSVAGPDAGTHVSTSPSASASPPPAAPKSCQIDRLPVPDGNPRSVVGGGDPTGRFMVGRAYGSTGYVDKHPLLIWDNTKLTRVDMPGDDEDFTDINSAGVAVGGSFGGSDTQNAYVYRDGKLSKLPAPAGGARAVSARAIGENGTIAGNLGGGNDPYRPLVWRDPGAQAQLLPLPDGFPEGQTVDVDTDGTIVGTVSVANSRGPDGGDHGYVWNPDGTGRLIPLPVVDGQPAPTFWSISIHDGVVFGRASSPHADGSVTFQPLLFDLRTGRYTPLTQGFGLIGNSLGWIAGVDKGGLFVAAPTGRATLPTLAPDDGNPATPTMSAVTYMSADGLVIGGHSADANGQIQAVRWRCTTVV
jgi:hypothetical protein